MDYSAIVAKHLLQINAIKLSPAAPFTWASGMKSPIYCDNRLSLSHPEVRSIIKQGFCEMINASKYDGIVGVATAGIPHGALVADALGLPFAYVRSKAKAHGRQNRLEGTLPEGAKVILIEDLISTGGSSLSALNYMRTAGFECSKIAAIFSYGLKIATDNFEQERASYQSLSNFNTLLTTAKETNYINEEAYAQLVEWQKNPKKWSDRRS